MAMAEWRKEVETYDLEGNTGQPREKCVKTVFAVLFNFINQHHSYCINSVEAVSWEQKPGKIMINFRST